ASTSTFARRKASSVCSKVGKVTEETLERCNFRNRNTGRFSAPSVAIDRISGRLYSSPHAETTRLQAGTQAPGRTPAGGPRPVRPAAGRKPFAAREPGTARRRKGEPCSAQ